MVVSVLSVFVVVVLFLWFWSFISFLFRLLFNCFESVFLFVEFCFLGMVFVIELFLFFFFLVLIVGVWGCVVGLDWFCVNINVVLDDGLVDGISRDGGGWGCGVCDGVDDWCDGVDNLCDGVEVFLDGVGVDI